MEGIHPKNEEQNQGKARHGDGETTAAEPVMNNNVYDGGRDSRDDDEDRISQTSTELFEGHQPFDIYKYKVLGLCHTLWPSHSFDDFQIERIEGGTFHRVISVNVTQNPAVAGSLSTADIPSSKVNIPTSGEFVLCIPRDRDTTLHAERRKLALVGEYTLKAQIGVPVVIKVDKSTNNTLGQPYVLQRRIPGQRLDYCWGNLNHTQRLCIAKQLAGYFAAVEEMPNACGGLPIPGLHSPIPKCEMVETIGWPFPDDESKITGRKMPVEPPIDMVRRRLNRWAEYDDAHPGLDSPWRGLIAVVNDAQAKSQILGETPQYFLHHGDLFPRNIMVIMPDDHIASISGILDWDTASFAPAVIAFTPPAWLWMKEYWMREFWKEGHQIEKELCDRANEIPKDVEARDIKMHFESITGPIFRQYAYSPGAGTVRRIWETMNLYNVDRSRIIREMHDSIRKASAEEAHDLVYTAS